jgi:drug/metabolite transporter (DMT)-like permease
MADPLAHKEHVVRGMVAALAAFFMFTVMNVFAKLLSANHSVIEIAFYRNLIASLPFLFWCSCSAGARSS